MTTWQPGADDRYCAACGASRRLHTVAGKCPTAYRPPTLADAYRDLAAAEAAGDQARTFVARGDVQRLGGDPDRPGTAAGWAGPAPYDPAEPDGDP